MHKFHLNDKITNKFSVVQSIYNVDSDDPIYRTELSIDILLVIKLNTILR